MVLVLWYLNKWLLHVKNPIKSSLGLILATFLLNGVAVVFLVLMDMIYLHYELVQKTPIWLMVLRLSSVIIIFNVVLRVFKAQKERAFLQYQNLRLQAENLKFQIDLMKQQINPHFLFNSLNTLLDLIEEDQEAAVRYVRSFSKLYRIVLQSAKHDFVTLEDELQFLREYWSLLKERFRDAIDLHVDIPETRMNDLIPPLSLQFLVENAIKHNEASKKTPLTIAVTSFDHILEVKNKVNKKKYNVASEKVGLKNLQQRFTMLHQPIQYELKGEYYTVRLPLKQE
jgi:LytS/YehU family sensor histidine kinase